MANKILRADSIRQTRALGNVAVVGNVESRRKYELRSNAIDGVELVGDNRL